MGDLNNELFAAIKKETGDDLSNSKRKRRFVSAGKDDELLKATLYFLTVMLKRVTGTSKSSRKSGSPSISEVIPFVS